MRRERVVSQRWARPAGSAVGELAATPRSCTGSLPGPAWETKPLSAVRRSLLPGAESALPRPDHALYPDPAPGCLAPPSRARAGGVAFKSSPVFWGPRAGRADLVRMSRAVTPAPGSMCAAEGRIIWPAARAVGPAERAPRARAAPQAERERVARCPRSLGRPAPRAPPPLGPTVPRTCALP